MKIGFFSDSYFPQVSGVSTSIKLLKDQLEAQGHEVVIFTTTDPNAQEEENIVRLPSIPFVSFEDRRIAYAGFDKCLRLAKKENFDIIHTHTEFSLGLAGKYVASRLKIPAVHTYHTMYEHYTHYIMNGHLIQPKHARAFSRIFCNHADHVITPSHLTAQSLAQYGVCVPLHVVPTGVKIPEISLDGYKLNRYEMRTKLGLSENDWVLLSLSRLSKEKQIDQIIAAFPDIQAALPEAYLMIVGDGPHRQELEEQVQSLGIERIKFIGEIPYDQVTRYYQMADVYVNASESETQGLTFLESWVNLLPIIAKKNEFLENLLQTDSFGRLYETASQLAPTVIEYSKLKQSGKISTIHNQDLFNISVEKFGQDIEQVYQSMIEQYDDKSKTRKTFERFQQTMIEFVRDVMIGQDYE